MVNKLFTLTNILLFILIIFSSLLLLSTDISKIKDIIPFLKFYQKNQSSKLIHSIEAVDPKEDCPKNSFPLSLYTYPGTSKGCLISNNTLKKDSCSIWSKLFKSTDEIEETSQKTFDTIFSKKLCAFSYNENNYINNIDNNGENKENKKLCGLLDTNGIKYYIENDKECPINKIIINNKISVNDDKFTFNSVELIKDKYYLHYSNDFNETDDNSNFLLTDDSLFISEGYPCINPDEINTYHIQYILSNKNNSYICDTNIENKRLDTRYSPIINIQKNVLYQDNNIDLESFFNYPFKDSDLTLYQLGYIGTDSNFNSEIIPKVDKISSDIYSISDFNYINQIIIKIIYSMLFIIVISIICKYFISDNTIYIWNSAVLASILVNFVFNIIVNNSLNNLGVYDKYYLNKNNDEIFNLQMKYINDIINDSKWKNNKIIIGNILIFILLGLFNFINYFVFNNPKNFILKYKGKIDYGQDKKYYNSINLLKPTSFDLKKENSINLKEEIELPRINNEIDSDNDNDENDNIIDNNKDEEESNLTTEINDKQ